MRIKDLDFDNRLIQIHQSKGDRSRFVPLPNDLMEPLLRYVKSRESLHEHDLADGTASVWLPHQMATKFPAAHREFKWQYLFASARLSRDPRTRNYRAFQNPISKLKALRNLTRLANAGRVLKCESCTVIICTAILFQDTFAGRWERQTFKSTSLAILFVIVLQRIFYAPEPIFARFRIYWAIKMWQRR